MRVKGGGGDEWCNRIKWLVLHTWQFKSPWLARGGGRVAPDRRRRDAGDPKGTFSTRRPSISSFSLALCTRRSGASGSCSKVKFILFLSQTIYFKCRAYTNHPVYIILLIRSNFGNWKKRGGSMHFIGLLLNTQYPWACRNIKSDQYYRKLLI